MPRFDTLLIANRGEIACRIIRTARSLGLATVAVHSAADEGALHVRLADRAVPIGPAAAAESYLRIDRIVEACRASGAQAVHPGYGFLAESAELARACRDAGLVFVGPTPEAIEALGNKSAAKRLARRIGVPCLPGYDDADQSPATLLARARKIGAPLMIKAAAGGGGRGMRRCDDVADEAALLALLESARAEAEASFGSGELLLERLVEHARHVEVQVFGDAHGNCVHLGERDCSTQRRNQKILEEAPAPGLSPERRRALGEAAVLLAREVGYVGAGTVEFLLAPDGGFHFLEMNTRLQVEHPVTEAITGLDLVEWQLRIAQGEALPLAQPDVRIRGHAIEARLCAEDAFAGFVPQSGDILDWSLPGGAGVRVDHGLAERATVPPHYDSLIAKVIAWGDDRETARERLCAALRGASVLGIVTNREYLLAALSAPEFVDARLSTRWLGERGPSWRPAVPDSRWTATAAALAVHRTAARFGPLGFWSSTGARTFPLRISLPGGDPAVRVATDGTGRCDVEGDAWKHSVVVEARDGANSAVRVDGVLHAVRVAFADESAWLDAFGASFGFADVTHAPPKANRRGSGGRIASSMHGLVTKVAVKAGQSVRRGELLLAIEAMKMEHRIEAPVDGIVTEVAVSAGQQVAPGHALATVEDAAGGAG